MLFMKSSTTTVSAKVLLLLLLFVSIVSSFTLHHATTTYGIQHQQHPRMVIQQQQQQHLHQIASRSNTVYNSNSNNAASEEATTTTKSVNNENQPKLIINGHNIALTTSLTEYIEKRIGITVLSKLSGIVQECDVVLSVNKNPKVKNGHRVEIVTNVKGTTIICKTESPDMYSSIDNAAAALQRKLIQYKERRINGYHGGSGSSNAKNGISDDFATLLEDAITDIPDLEVNGTNEVEELQKMDIEKGFIDADQPKVVKVNSFQLNKSISLEEAIFALDYVDHDFYVFRNDKTNEINVVYKRHAGGIGLVEP